MTKALPKFNIRSVVKSGMCTGCGTCAGLCPTGAISISLDQYRGLYVPQIQETKCNSCGICIHCCPGHGVNFKKFYLDMFNNEPDDLVLGNYDKIYIGNATDSPIRYNSASGGLITASLLFALKDKIIDGAIVTRMSANNPLEPEPFIARTPEEIIQSARSKYCPVPTNMILNQLLEQKGKYAFVGLPCHVHGIRKAMADNPDLNQKIIFILGLVCGHTDTLLMTEFILKLLEINPSDIKHISYRGQGWPGNMQIELRNGSSVSIPFTKYIALHDIDMFTPPRCLLCHDTTNKLADISFGDAWGLGHGDDQGLSIAITRSNDGIALLKNALSNDKLILEEVEAERIGKWRPTAFKMKRAAAKYLLLKLISRKLPSYNAEGPNPGIVDHVAVFISYIAYWIGSSRWLWPSLILTFPLLALTRKAKKGISKIYR